MYSGIKLGAATLILLTTSAFTQFDGFVAGVEAAARSTQALLGLKQKYRAPSDMPVPPENPQTPEKIALGRKLYFDPSLSKTGTVACASCHDPRAGFEDGKDRSIGVTGERLPRHSPTTINLAWSEAYFWDGRAASLEEQALGPIAAEKEMGMPHDLVVSKLQANPEYTRQFAAAFPGEDISIQTFAKAIAAFERTLTFTASPFDAWLAGDEDAISATAKRGFMVFNGKGRCAECHSGWNFTDDSFHDIGLKSEDQGRYAILQIDALKHAFKTPGLRNIRERAPYMHDGSLPTLASVIDHYNDGFVHRETLSDLIKPLGLTKVEKAELVAFLETLSTPVPEDLKHDAEKMDKSAALVTGNTSGGR